MLSRTILRAECGPGIHTQSVEGSAAREKTPHKISGIYLYVARVDWASATDVHAVGLHPHQIQLLHSAETLVYLLGSS